jgi:hypothetical protein
MKVGAALLALASVGLVEAGFLSEKLGADEKAFMHYLHEYGKSYGTKEEFKFRLGEFRKQMKIIAEHDEAKAGHSVGLNQFSDWTDAEYKRMLGFKYNKDLKADESIMPVKEFELDPTVTVPDSVDWRDQGAVSPVKN